MCVLIGCEYRKFFRPSLTWWCLTCAIRSSSRKSCERTYVQEMLFHWLCVFVQCEIFSSLKAKFTSSSACHVCDFGMCQLRLVKRFWTTSWQHYSLKQNCRSSSIRFCDSALNCRAMIQEDCLCQKKFPKLAKKNLQIGAEWPSQTSRLRCDALHWTDHRVGDR